MNLMAKTGNSIVILGDNTQGGTYILRLKIAHKITLAFGRFKKGMQIPVPMGECLYIGSALRGKGATSLGRRLVRHATRSDSRPPHPIREALLVEFDAIGLGSGDLRPRSDKRLHWNVDHLLDHPAVELIGVIAIRSKIRLESRLADLLENDPQTFIIEKGLGAGDARGETHVLGVSADEAWWYALADRISAILK